MSQKKETIEAGRRAARDKLVDDKVCESGMLYFWDTRTSQPAGPTRYCRLESGVRDMAVSRGMLIKLKVIKPDKLPLNDVVAKRRTEQWRSKSYSFS